jgi:hypothetical protein
MQSMVEGHSPDSSVFSCTFPSVTRFARATSPFRGGIDTKKPPTNHIRSGVLLEPSARMTQAGPNQP